ncbi:MAG TPA: very short patch repair endonuclease [Hyphomonadaceae bacterium]|nr:very short patch repair endonuclease [Hyphomonadaceae bacterium]
MADVFDSEKRSAVMRAVKSKDTTPELAVRRSAHKIGLRFRLGRDDLPGKPDLVFPARQTAMFVHGCFWHGHECPRGARMPATNRDYWRAKIARNVERDKTTKRKLKALGWKVVTIWECETRDPEKLQRLISRRLGVARRT